MEKKLYYTDPLAAAYMAREFGVEFQQYISSRHPDGKSIYVDIKPCVEHLMHQAIYVAKFYIHPDSHHIFEPQKGDMEQWGLTYEGEYEGEWTDFDMVNRKHQEIASNLKIIQRNNKPFFWPEEEA